MMTNSNRYIEKLLTTHLLLPGSVTLIVLSFDYWSDSESHSELSLIANRNSPTVSYIQNQSPLTLNFVEKAMTKGFQKMLEWRPLWVFYALQRLFSSSTIASTRNLDTIYEPVDLVCFLDCSYPSLILDQLFAPCIRPWLLCQLRRFSGGWSISV